MINQRVFENQNYSEFAGMQNGTNLRSIKRLKSLTNNVENYRT